MRKPIRREKAARMQKRTKLERQLLIAGCAGLIFASTGCRSAMPKWNMFSWRSTPSAETLAGNGPTITYPAPPSESATPDAIASVAGGTTGSVPETRIASSTQSPSSAMEDFDNAVSAANRATTPVNPAAAQANGFSFASSRTPSTAAASTAPGYAGVESATTDNHSSVPSIPAGYQFGTRSTSASPTSGSSRYSMPSSYPAPSVDAGASTGQTNGSTGQSVYAMPGGTSPVANSTTSSAANSGFALPSTGTTSTPTQSSGFSLPDSMLQSVSASAGESTASNAINPQPFTPKTTSSPGTTTAGISLPSGSATTTPATPVSTGSAAASFSTASAALTPRSIDASSKQKVEGYAPGSTAGATSYPTTSGYPSTGTEGSFYR